MRLVEGCAEKGAQCRTLKFLSVDEQDRDNIITRLLSLLCSFCGITETEKRRKGNEHKRSCTRSVRTFCN